MIKNINPDLAKVKSDYGYNFYDKEPLLSRLISLLGGILPKSFTYQIYRLNKKRKQKESYVEKMIRVHPFIAEYIKQIERLNLPLKLENIIKSDLHGPSLIAMGHLLKRYEDKLR